MDTTASHTSDDRVLLYLIRHAHAVDESEDPRRPLSAQGRAQVARLVTAFRRDARLTPAQFWHSSLARSRETAALLAEGLSLTVPRVPTPGLEPEDDPSELLPRLAKLQASVAIVGHEPHLGLLASLLLGRNLNSPAWGFKKGEVRAFAKGTTAWSLSWETSPGA